MSSEQSSESACASAQPSAEVRIGAVVACTPNYGIGKSGTLPWAAVGVSLPADLRYFRDITTRTDDPTKLNVALMGRRTWLGIPEKNRPLTKRLNMVLTSDEDWAKYNLPSEVMVASDFESAICLILDNPELCNRVERIMVIGGVDLFERSLFHPLCDSYHFTKIDEDFESDTFLTAKTIERLRELSPVKESDILSENGVSYRMQVFDPR